ncbi:MAG: MBL fold metallo-hydrolase [Betaproteobacteria bacterium]|nr:MAG: MBL fold metallo-hydrolase [Betaproteobacteria bacterium]
MTDLSLPPNITFIERDWLSANHVVFRDSDGATLLDTGYIAFADVTLAKLDAALGGAPLKRIINTHLHSDHIGCNGVVQRAHPGATITIPADEVSAMENWDSPEQMLSYADQEAEPFAWDAVIEAGQTLTLGGLQWQTIATPGHDMGSLVLYSPKERILISADALWHNSFGFVVPQAIDPQPLQAQRATFKRLAELDVALVIPGHGPMFTDFSASLQNASDKLEAFAQDDMKIAKNVVKGMFIYSMMWREIMPVSELVSYVKRIGVHRDYNAWLFKLSDEAYADWLLSEAIRTGKVTVGDGVIRTV